MGESTERKQRGPRRRGLLRAVRILAASLIIAVALLLGAVRVALPLVGDYRPEVAYWVGQMLGQQVHIGGLSAGWEGWTPEVDITDVILFDPATGKEVARFARARLTLDVLASLREWTFRPGRLLIAGAALSVTRLSDGSLTIAGMGEQAGTPPGRGEALIVWLLGQPRLRVQNATLQWHDLTSQNGAIALRDVNLRIHNHGDHHQVRGAGDLPPAFGTHVTFAADVQGNPLGRDWSGTLFLAGKRLALSAWPIQDASTPLRLAGGTADVRLWTTWSHARLQRLQAQVDVEDLAVQAASRELTFESGGGDVLLRRTDRGWSLDLDGAHLTTESGRWPETRASVRLVSTADGTGKRYVGQINFLRLQDVVPLVSAAVPTPVAASLSELAPRGDLEDVNFVLPASGDLQQGYFLQARFRDLATRAYGRIPGVSGAAGRVEVQPLGGTLEIDDHPLEVTAPALYDQPLAIRHAHGRIEWQWGAGGWSVQTPELAASNQDLSLQLAGTAREAQAGGSPQLDLVARLEHANLARLPRYLPAGVVPAHLRGWLVRALRSGEITSGAVLVHGALADFPFDQGQGRLTARLDLQSTKLDYAAGWPTLDAQRIALRFEGRGLHIALSGGSLLDAHIPDATAKITDLGSAAPVLEADGRIDSGLGTLLRVLRESPLAAVHAKVLGQLRAGGETHLALHFALPLAGGGAPHFDGQLDLHAASLAVAGDPALDLSAMNGTVRFSDRGIEAQGLEARYLGEPIRVEVGPTRGKAGGTTIRLVGTADAKTLVRMLGRLPGGAEAAPSPPVLGAILDGKTKWQATVALPKDLSATSSVPVRLDSDLRGLALKLPPPFDKVAETPRTLALETSLGSGDTYRVRARYGDIVGALLDLHESKEGLSLQQGRIEFGAGAPKLAEGGGITVGGDVADFSIERWIHFIDSLPHQAATRTDTHSEGSDWHFGPALLANLRAVQIHFGRLTLVGYPFPDTTLDAKRGPEGGWKGKVLGKTLQGSIDVPPHPGPAPVLVALDRMDLAERIEHFPITIDPAHIPPIAFTCRKLVYQSHPLGGVRLVTTPEKDGLRVDTLDISGDVYHATGKGYWHLVDGHHSSHLQATVRSDNLGAMVTAFGYAGSGIAGGDTEIMLNGSWPGPPADFALKNLNGNLHIRATNGRLPDVDPGTAGRVFGLLSLQALPRRLTGDFSDLFQSGLAFDVIEGSFNLAGGDAYTNDLHLQGPAVRIDVAGRVGLAAEDYDEVVTVSPNIGSTLPLAGAFLGPAGIGAGAAMWLAEKLFDSDFLGRALAQQYTVTGPWRDPVVKPLAPPEQAPSSNLRGH